MCLCRSLETDKLKQATEDIVCYKGVQVPDEEWFKLKTRILRKLKRLTHYQTYFMCDEVVIGRAFIAKPILSQDALDKINLYKDHLEEGFIHSFVNEQDARDFAKERCYIDVVKCIIPKGAYYFKGANSDDTEGYASTQIKYVKVI